MDAYIAKPFTMAQLHEMLARWLLPGSSAPRDPRIKAFAHDTRVPTQRKPQFLQNA